MNYIPVSVKCNLNCEHCCPRTWSHGTPNPDAAAHAIATASRRKMASLCFSGGEPALEKTLPALIGFAKKKGIPEVGIHTNGIMLAYREYLDRLLDAGTDFFRIAVCETSPARYDAAVRVPGAFAILEKALESLSSVMKSVIAVVPVTAKNIGRLEEYHKFALKKNIEAVVFRPVFPVNARDALKTMPDMLRLKTVFREIIPLFQDSGIRLNFEATPYCALVAEDWVPEKFAEANGLIYSYRLRSFVSERDILGFRLAEKCAPCMYNKTCPGVSPLCLKTSGEEAIQPVQVFGALHKGDRQNLEIILRINTVCNQKCLFCWVRKDIPEPTEEETLDRIRKFAEQGGQAASISGGEPTIHPALFRFLSEMRKLSFKDITLQTNAIKCAEPGFSVKLAKAGVTTAFVSFHSHKPELSDKITCAKGTFQKTVEGVKNIKKAGIKVIINLVINSMNYEELPGIVKFIHREFHTVKKPVVISFSYVAPMGGFLAQNSWIVPRYSEAAAPIKEAVDLCIKLGIPFSNLAGQCGIPQCILGGKDTYFPDRTDVGRGEFSLSFLKPRACHGCILYGSCYGIRADYVRIHGDAEVSPVK